jgi:hypothetical protein
MERQTAKDVYLLDRTFGLVGRLDGVSIAPDGGAWANVDLGGVSSSSVRRLVSLRGAQWWSGYVRLDCSRHRVRTAPGAIESPLLEPADVALLRAHYAADPA